MKGNSRQYLKLIAMTNWHIYSEFNQMKKDN